MNSKIIRVLIVDSDPSSVEDTLRLKLDRLPGVELVGVAHSQRGALSQVDSTQPNFLLVDLMLPGYRSIDLISQINGGRYTESQVLSPENVAMMHRPAVETLEKGMSYAFGWRTNLVEGEPVFGTVVMLPVSTAISPFHPHMDGELPSS